MPRAPTVAHSSIAEPYTRPRSSNNQKSSQQATFSKNNLLAPIAHPAAHLHTAKRPCVERPVRNTTHRPPGMGSRPGKAPVGNSWQGCKLEDLPRENQNQINRSTITLNSWEQLALHGAARGESIPQTRLREMQALIRAVDAAPPPPSVPYSGPNPTPYVSSTFTPRAHDPPPKDSITGRGYYHNHQQPNQTSPSYLRTSEGYGGNYNGGHGQHRRDGVYGQPAAGEAWWDDVDIAWEDRFKSTGSAKNKDGRGISGWNAKGSGSASGGRQRDRPESSDMGKGKKRTR